MLSHKTQALTKNRRILELKPDRSVYAPGESIHVTCIIDNITVLIGHRLIVRLRSIAELTRGQDINNHCELMQSNLGYAQPHGTHISLSDVQVVQSAIVWKSDRISGRILHPKRRELSAVLVLPIDACPSFSLPPAIQHYDRMHLSYVIDAELFTTEAETFQAQISIQVVMPTPKSNPPIRLPRVPSSITSNGCYHIAATLDQSVYTLGRDAVGISFDIANYSINKIKRFNLSIVERQFSPMIEDDDGVSRRVMLCSLAVDSAVPGRCRRSVSAVLRPMSNIPIAPSVTGSAIVGIEHFVVIELVMTNVFILSRPCFEVPIQFVGAQQSP
eukprot:jgi/Hompol1/5563/HPOL_004545-RA